MKGTNYELTDNQLGVVTGGCVAKRPEKDNAAWELIKKIILSEYFRKIFPKR